MVTSYSYSVVSYRVYYSAGSQQQNLGPSAVDSQQKVLGSNSGWMPAVFQVHQLCVTI